MLSEAAHPPFHQDPLCIVCVVTLFICFMPIYWGFAYETFEPLNLFKSNRVCLSVAIIYNVCDEKRDLNLTY